MSALKAQLVEAFDTLDSAPLSAGAVSELPAGQGVYQLFRNDMLVYIGKADNLPGRLRQHFLKISGRMHISIEEMKFKCLYIHQNWTALAPETSLIRNYKTTSPDVCAWNGNSFGSHDPGRERDTTDKPVEGFDAQFPIRLDWKCIGIRDGSWKVAELLKTLKQELPFLLRFEAYQKMETDARRDFDIAAVVLDRTPLTAQGILVTIAKALPGWQATAFPSHLILYKESAAYKHGVTLWPERDVKSRRLKR